MLNPFVKTVPTTQVSRSPIEVPLSHLVCRSCIRVQSSFLGNGDWRQTLNIFILSTLQRSVCLPLYKPTTVKETFNRSVPLTVAMHLPKLCHLILEKLFRAQDQIIINVDAYHTEKFLRGWIAEQKESGTQL